jgi:hypothetical protein
MIALTVFSFHQKADIQLKVRRHPFSFPFSLSFPRRFTWCLHGTPATSSYRLPLNHNALLVALVDSEQMDEETRSKQRIMLAEKTSHLQLLEEESTTESDMNGIDD